MIVRTATAADAGAIALIHVRSWQAAYRGLMPDELLDGLSVADREDTWRREISGHGRLLWVAERDGVLTGFCAVAVPSRDEDAGSDVAEIAAIYVEPGAWRSGSGAALMEAALDRLGMGEWREVTLWVLEGNRSAIDFYARWGFHPDGGETVYARSGTTGIRMRRPLRSGATLSEPVSEPRHVPRGGGSA